MREGSEYVEPVDTTNWTSGQAGNKGVRVFTFQRGLDKDVIIEVGDANIVALDQTGTVVVGGVTDNLIPPAWNAYNIFGFGTPAAEWGPNRDYQIHNTDPGRFIIHGLEGGYAAGWFGIANIFGFMLNAETDNAPTDGWHGPAGELQDGFPIILPAGSELLLNEISLDVTSFFLGDNPTNPKVRVDIGTTQGASDVYTTDISLGSANVRTPVTLSFTPGASNNELYITVGFVWTTGVVPSLGGYGDSGKGVTVFIENLDWRAPLAGGSGTDVKFTSPYTRAQLDCLQYDMDPGEQVAYFFHPEVETQRLRLATGEWTLEALSSITVPSAFQAPTPNNWTTDNYPAAGAFHEGRLWLAGSPINPSTLWASESGDYQNFDNVTPADKADPLLFPLSSTGQIQSLTSRKVLVINTDISEVIGTSELGVIAFDDFSFPKQTDWGSTCTQPVVVGRDMIFTSNSRQRMRTFQDGGDSIGGWDGQELSLLAQELFRSKVRRMIYLDEPAYQACFLLEDGTLAMATYFYPENVIGWWTYVTAYNGNRDSGDETKPGEPGQGPNLNQQLSNQIMDITKINTSQGAKLWMIVNRTGFSGTTLPGHEVVAFDTLRVPLLDSFATRLIDPVTKKISDIDHLTDQSINCVIERTDPTTGVISFTVHPNITAVAGVSTEFEDWAIAEGNIAHVGIFYDNEVKLLPIENVSNRGTSQITKRRWNKVVLRLNESAVPFVNGEYPKDRSPSTPMGTGEPIESVDREYSELGTDQGELVVTQDKPLRTEILAIFGKITSGEI